MNRMRIGVSGALLAFVLAASFSGTCPPDNQITVLDCDGDEVDFGEVTVGSVQERTVTASVPMVREHGGIERWAEADVRVDGFTGCGDDDGPISVLPLPLTMREFESAALTLRFNPLEARSWDCALQPSYEAANTNIDPGSYEIIHTCRIGITGSAVEGAPPVCSVQPAPNLAFGTVDIGSSSSLTLTIRNETPDALTTNQFRYSLTDLSGACHLFPLVDPADTAHVIGPDGTWEVAVRFTPEAEGDFECRRSLASLKEPADPADPSIANACPAEIVWQGSGRLGAPVWTACASGVSSDLHGVSGLSADAIYVAGDSGRVLSSTGSCQWGAAGTGLDDVHLRDIWAHAAASDTALWAVGNIPPPPGMYGETGAILTSNGGQWEKKDEGIFVTYGAVWGSTLDDVYFAGTGISTDFPNAKHWNGSALDTLHISPMGMSTVSGVRGNAANDIWAVLRQPTYSVYHYDGNEWTNETQQWMSKPLHDVWSVAGSGYYQVYAVGEDGAIYHFDGTDWTDESIPGETRDLYGVWVSGTGHVFAVGEAQVIYHYDGNAWTLHSPPDGLPAGDLMDVWGAADDNVLAVGTGGVILRYSPQGTVAAAGRVAAAR